ncbi:jg26888 [Pararge aegeria aegeria]|uniref:proteasome endopeptidase complex n=1 Tax=Pararge aegeria aegeria TaxID=348720 RepID=A0A8S4SGY5_9NEOP|nr:jg26888 [Pararge aegeria aegeria]
MDYPTQKIVFLFEPFNQSKSSPNISTDNAFIITDFHKIEVEDEPLVLTASTIFRELCYNYRDSLEASVLVAGWDNKEGGQIFSIPVGGALVRQAVAIGGSGSSYVYGYVDANFKPNMSKKKAIQFVTNTLTLAMLRDGSSGGVVRLGVITEAELTYDIEAELYRDFQKLYFNFILKQNQYNETKTWLLQ